MEKVTISETVLRQMKEHAEAAYPEECCGFLMGITEENSVRIEVVQNIGNEQKDNRERRFLITPKQYMDGEDLAEGMGLDLVGVYHSHPDHPAEPSEFDRVCALPNFVYPIIGVDQGKVAKVGWWFLKGKEFEPIGIVKEEPST